MTLCAYLAVGVALAQSGGPAVSLVEAQRGALRGMTDCEAVMAVAQDVTRFLGAEEFAREVMKLPEVLSAVLDGSPESLRALVYEVVRK